MSRHILTLDRVHDRGARYVVAIFDDALVAVRKQIDIIPLDPLAIAIWIIARLTGRRRRNKNDILRDAQTLKPEALAKAYSGSRLWRIEDIANAELTRHPRKLSCALRRGEADVVATS